MAADLITTAFKRQFADYFRDVAQQKISKTQSRVEVETNIGDMMYIDHVAKRSEAAAQLSLIQQTNLVEHTHYRRILRTAPYPDAIPLSKQALKRLVADPTYKYVEQQVAMYNRLKDKLVFLAAIADVTSITTDLLTTGTTSLPSTQKYQESGTVGMTVEKIVSAKKTFNTNDLDDTPAYLALSPQAIADLTLDPDLTVVDLMALEAVRNGEIRTLLGFEIMMSNQLYIASNIRHNIAWVKEGLVLGINEDIETDISVRKDLNLLTQIWSSMDVGAVRAYETMVFDIQAYEA